MTYECIIYYKYDCDRICKIIPFHTQNLTYFLNFRSSYLLNYLTYLSKTFHVQRYINKLQFQMKRSPISLRSQILQHTIHYHIKCVEKVPSNKLGHKYHNVLATYIKCFLIPLDFCVPFFASALPLALA